MELTGKKFGRWSVIEFSHRSREGRSIIFWLCQCECGTEKAVNQNNLLNGRSTSCGCLQKQLVTRHGHSRHPCYHTWHRMMRRCYDSERKDYSDYGGRGIKVCDRWHDVSNFMTDMLPSWMAGLTIERIDNNSDYAPDNCKWITHAEQALNTRKTVLIDSPWGRLPIAQVAKKAGINPAIFWRRVKSGETGDRLYSRTRLRRRQ